MPSTVIAGRIEYLQDISGQLEHKFRLRMNKTNRAPQIKPQRLQALNLWELQPLVWYVVKRLTAASSPHTRYSAGYCLISRVNSCRASSHLSEAIRESCFEELVCMPDCRLQVVNVE